MNQTLLQPLQNALSTFLSYLPQLVGAIIILIIGYIVAKVLQAVVGRVLQGIGFDGWMERGGIKQFFDRAETNQTPHSILGKLVFWFVLSSPSPWPPTLWVSRRSRRFWESLSPTSPPS